MGQVVQFIPRPNHNRETDFPTIAFRSQTPELRAIEPNHPHDVAIYESSLGFIAPDKDPA